MRKGKARRERLDTPYDEDSTQPINTDPWVQEYEGAPDLTEAIDKKAPVWMAVFFVVIIGALCLSGAAWAIVSMWKDILS